MKFESALLYSDVTWAAGGMTAMAIVASSDVSKARIRAALYRTDSVNVTASELRSELRQRPLPERLIVARYNCSDLRYGKPPLV